jgi:hypothetical protein
MDMAKASALYYHRYLLERENENSPYIPGLDYDMAALYADCEAEAIEFNAARSSG